ncbi:hypothetical protein Bcep18194_B2729 [Burkholderia lata]|uniref:Uncharacterized protein n=1 Tax=Burkholderia lata (strain ATCC 17760 / DSM 23089 / LMG 22485 / NCIMB 9086 / R18194 / 383) TaxID=482957 RepID=Q391M6_BURL3|nr:hypothetical protein Bcep18194_B2729 [Burkholderia lata]
MCMEPDGVYPCVNLLFDRRRTGRSRGVGSCARVCRSGAFHARFPHAGGEGAGAIQAGGSPGVRLRFRDGQLNVTAPRRAAAHESWIVVVWAIR